MKIHGKEWAGTCLITLLCGFASGCSDAETAVTQASLPGGCSGEECQLLLMPCETQADCEAMPFCDGPLACQTLESKQTTVDKYCQPVGLPPCSADLGRCLEEERRCECDVDDDAVRDITCNGEDVDLDGDTFAGPYLKFRERVERGEHMSLECQTGEMLVDCDDNDDRRAPNLDETCDDELERGLDEDCCASTVAGEGADGDFDGDGYKSRACFNRRDDGGKSIHGEDCDDHNASVPGASDDTCNGNDDDCDGKTDEGAAFTELCPDNDGDGWPESRRGSFSACSWHTGHAACPTREEDFDCSELDEERMPGALEKCDGKDDDCDGLIDEEVSWEREQRLGLNLDGVPRCDKEAGQWLLPCTPGWAPCGDLRNGCNVDVTKRSQCRSCEPTNCGFACGEQGCEEIVQVAVGDLHACAVTNEHRVACWGLAEAGRRGDDRQAPFLRPTWVLGTDRFTQVSVGFSHACAVTEGEGVVACWGDNTDRQLALLGSEDPFADRPWPISAGDLPGTDGVLKNALKVAVGMPHTCALMGDGLVVCWGYTADWVVGSDFPTVYGTGLPQPVSRRTDDPTSQARVVIRNAIDIAAGDEHACLVLDVGRVLCWGRNQAGQLGLPAGAPQTDPVPVQGVEQAVQVVAGARHTCALSGGQVYCWGSNDVGQLGARSSGELHIAQPVPGLNNIATIVAGYTTTCALSERGALSCWGGNSDVFGWKLEGPVSTVEPITLWESGVEDVAIGTFGCVSLENEGVKCWGDNSVGQLGTGEASVTPVPPSAAQGLQPAAGRRPDALSEDDP